jgi:type I restriction enzyme S subunit
MNKLLEQINRDTYHLKDVTSLVSRGITPAYVESDGVVVLNQKCIRNWAVSLSESRLTNKEKINSKHKMLEDGDILICSTGTGTLGRVAQINQVTMPTTVDSHVSIVRPEPEKVNPSYLGYILKKSEKLIESLAEGSTGQTELPRTKLEELEIVLPPLDIQNAITKIISAYDAKIENNTVIIKNLETMAQAIFDEWFVYFRFPGHERVKFVDSVTGKIPEGWEAKSVLDVVERISPGKKYENKTALPVGKVPILDQGASGYIGYHNDEPGVFANIDKPVIVFTNHTCYYRIITEPFSCIQNVLPYVGKNGYDTFFVYFLTKEKIKMSEYKGHWPEFEQQVFVLPPVKMARQFSEKAKKVIEKIVLCEKENVILKETRDKLLAKLI